jgi:hypothetical protein
MDSDENALVALPAKRKPISLEKRVKDIHERKSEKVTRRLFPSHM